MYKERALEEMKRFFKDDDHQIEHALKVLGYAEDIMEGEGLGDEEKELVQVTAILHDIGIPEARRKYGSSDAPYQEKEGAVIARQILEAIDYPSKSTDRVCYIIGSHHTHSKVDGPDFQIQWEADLLVNLEKMEIRKDKQGLEKFINNNFKTAVGRKIAVERFMN